MFVALGGDETLTFGLDDGFRRAWTRQVFTALPRSTVFVNAATEDATTRDGLDRQLADAMALDPTMVTVWFGAGDARLGTDPDRFAAELTELALALRNEGAKVILVGNEGSDSMATYLPIIESVARETGATYTGVPGPVGRPDDPTIQDSIAEAVLTGFGS